LHGQMMTPFCPASQTFVNCAQADEPMPTAPRRRPARTAILAIDARIDARFCERAPRIHFALLFTATFLPQWTLDEQGAAARPDRTDRLGKMHTGRAPGAECGIVTRGALTDAKSRGSPFLIALEDAGTTPERQKRSVGLPRERVRTFDGQPTRAMPQGDQTTIRPCVELKVFVGSLQFGIDAAFLSR